MTENNSGDSVGLLRAKRWPACPCHFLAHSGPTIPLNMAGGQCHLTCRRARLRSCQPGGREGGGEWLWAKLLSQGTGRRWQLLSIMPTTLGHPIPLSGLGWCFCSKGTRLLFLCTGMEGYGSQLCFRAFRVSSLSSLSLFSSFPYPSQFFFYSLPSFTPFVPSRFLSLLVSLSLWLCVLCWWASILGIDVETEIKVLQQHEEDRTGG